MYVLRYYVEFCLNYCFVTEVYYDTISFYGYNFNLNGEKRAIKTQNRCNTERNVQDNLDMQIFQTKHDNVLRKWKHSNYVQLRSLYNYYDSLVNNK